MLEKPALAVAVIVDCLRESYGVSVERIEFLPLGADLDTAVYRAVAAEGTPYFVKARRGVVDGVSVTLPRFLRDQGIAQVMAPLATRAGELLTDVGAFKLMLYPFVHGQSGREIELSARHWRELGAALARIHSVSAPPALAAGRDSSGKPRVEKRPCSTAAMARRRSIPKRSRTIAANGS